MKSREKCELLFEQIISSRAFELYLLDWRLFLWNCRNIYFWSSSKCVYHFWIRWILSSAVYLHRETIGVFSVANVLVILICAFQAFSLQLGYVDGYERSKEWVLVVVRDCSQVYFFLLELLSHCRIQSKLTTDLPEVNYFELAEGLEIDGFYCLKVCE